MLNTSQWCQVADGLLSRFYGLSLNDTSLSDIAVVEMCIKQDLQPWEVINECVEKYSWSRINAHPYFVGSNLLTLEDEIALLSELHFIH